MSRKFGISKGARLPSFAAEHSVAPDKILAVGDNRNDITMLSAAGLGIAMGNADEAVKALAKRSVGSNDSDAIAEAIDALLAETGDDRGIAPVRGQGSWDRRCGNRRPPPPGG